MYLRWALLYCMEGLIPLVGYIGSWVQIIDLNRGLFLHCLTFILSQVYNLSYWLLQPIILMMTRHGAHCGWLGHSTKIKIHVSLQCRTNCNLPGRFRESGSRGREANIKAHVGGWLCRVDEWIQCRITFTIGPCLGEAGCRPCMSCFWELGQKLF